MFAGLRCSCEFGGVSVERGEGGGGGRCCFVLFMCLAVGGWEAGCLARKE